MNQSRYISYITIPKKLANVHFTTIPCEPNIAKFFPELTTLNIQGLKFSELFWIFTRSELWINVPIAIFFGTADHMARYHDAMRVDC